MFTAYRYRGPGKGEEQEWQKIYVVAEDGDPNFLWIKNSHAQKESERVMFSMIYCAPGEHGHRPTFNWKTALAEKAAKDAAVKVDDDAAAKKAAEEEAAKKAAARQ